MRIVILLRQLELRALSRCTCTVKPHVRKADRFRYARRHNPRHFASFQLRRSVGLLTFARTACILARVMNRFKNMESFFAARPCCYGRGVREFTGSRATSAARLGAAAQAERSGTAGGAVGRSACWRPAEDIEAFANVGRWTWDVATGALTCSPQLIRIYGLASPSLDAQLGQLPAAYASGRSGARACQPSCAPAEHRRAVPVSAARQSCVDDAIRVLRRSRHASSAVRKVRRCASSACSAGRNRACRQR